MKFDKRLVGEIRKKSAYVILLLLTSILIGFFIVLQAWFFSKIVNDAFLGHMHLQDLKTPIIILALVIILRAFFVWANSLIATNLSMSIRDNLRRRLMEKIVELGPSFTRSERTGELVSTLTEGIEKLDPYIREYIPQVILTAVIPLMVLIFVFPRDFYTGLIFIITAPLIPFFMVLIGLVAEKVTKRQWRTLGKMSAYLLDVIQGLTTLKALNRSRAEKERLRRIVDEFRKTTISVLKVAFISALTLELIATLSTAIVAVEIGLRLLYAKLQFSEAFFILLLAPEFYTPFRQLGAKFHAGMAGVEAANRIFEILKRETGKKPHITVFKFKGSIIFQNVRFSYGEREVLYGVNLEIKKGEKVALVGPTGAGKSTIAQLLLKFFEPDDGTILVDGIPLDQIDDGSWRKLISWVPQNPYIFNSTVLENIRLAKPDASMEEVEMAAKKAYAHEFIKDLPDGYDTQVGEQGTRLSGGQVQRIALARAFLKNAPILILDEATANLDPEIERKITLATEELLKNKTALIIAHRLTTVYRADKIAVVRDGRIIETGTHDELIREGGFYSKLVRGEV